VGNPIKVDGVDQRYTAPPHPGEHTAEVLREMIHLSDERLADLQRRGIVHDEHGATTEVAGGPAD
jgi:crotonobetainyl-CoA:carnitine CoA-transferase CaiB-like acyl-CoA transferase